MKKKVVSLLLASAMVVSLVGCGNPEGSGEAAPAQDAANTEAEQPAADAGETAGGGILRPLKAVTQQRKLPPR